MHYPLDPAELVQLIESLLGIALTQRLGRLSVVTLLPQDFRHLGHPQAR